MKRILPAIVILVIVALSAVACTAPLPLPQAQPTVASVATVPTEAAAPASVEALPTPEEITPATGVEVTSTASISATVTGTLPAMAEPMTATIVEESTPIDAGTPAVQAAVTAGPVTDYASLLASLGAYGASVEATGDTSGSLFSGTGHVLHVDGAEVQVFEYADNPAAAADVARISPDGATVGEDVIDWSAPPHVFYTQGRVLVIYTGSDTGVLGALVKALGPQFAGAPMPATPTPGAETAAAITATITATVAAEPTTAPTPGQTATPRPSCTDRAVMALDVTIPDNTNIPAGQQFVKTWRLRNTGTCTWTTDYALVFAKGEQMGGPDSVPFPQSVKPGASVDLSVMLTAPAGIATYKGNWTLRNVEGKNFGITNSSDATFWVQIVVGPTSKERLNFPAGGASAKVQATLIQGVSRAYVARATSGQHVTVASSTDVNLKVLDPGGKKVTSLAQTEGQPHWEFDAPATGDYTLVVSGEGQFLLTVSIAQPASAQAVTTGVERITFEAGTTTATRDITLPSGGSKSFIVAAEANQQMHVVVSEPGVAVMVFDSDRNTINPSSLDGNGRYLFRLPEAGDYTLALSGSGQNKISIEMPPPGTVSREPILFPVGKTSVSLVFTLADGETQEYQLKGEADQHLVLTPGQSTVTVHVYGTDGDLLVPVSSEASGGSGYVLPATGNYVIAVEGAGTNTLTVAVPAQ